MFSLTKGYLVDQWSQLPIYKCHHHLSDQLKSPLRGSCWALGENKVEGIIIYKWQTGNLTENIDKHVLSQIVQFD